MSRNSASGPEIGLQGRILSGPYTFIGFGAMDVTKPYSFTRFGAMDVTKPYTCISFGAMDVTKPYNFTRFGAMDFVRTATGKAPRSALRPAEGADFGSFAAAVRPQSGPEALLRNIEYLPFKISQSKATGYSTG